MHLLLLFLLPLGLALVLLAVAEPRQHAEPQQRGRHRR